MGRPKKKQLNEWLRKRRKSLPKSLFKKKVMTDGMSAVYNALWAIRGRTNRQFTATHKEIGERAGISPSTVAYNVKKLEKRGDIEVVRYKTPHSYRIRASGTPVAGRN